jgi:hypothetical protein
MMLALLADADATFLHLGDRFREGGTQFGWQSVSIVVGVALAVGLALWLAARWVHHREGRVVHSPQKLLKELCAAHELNYRERQLVAGLARQHKLADPAVLFVEPALFSAAALGSWWQRHQQELDRLRDKLFARG